MAEGLLDFLSLGDLGDLERPDLERLDLGRSDLALSLPSSAGGGLEAVSLSDLSGDSALSTGSLNDKQIIPIKNIQEKLLKYRKKNWSKPICKTWIKSCLLFSYLNKWNSGEVGV